MLNRFVLIPLLLLGIFLTNCTGERPTFKVGYMICNSLEESRARFDPLTAWIGETIGADLEPVYLDTVDFEEAYEKGDLDFTHTNSALFITLADRHKVKLVAAEKRGAYGAKTRGAIIARKGAGIETLADLKGKRLVFGPQWAPFGFLSQYALMAENGVDPETDLGFYAFPKGSWKHEKIIYSVLYGKYDAGAAPMIDLEEMTRDGRISPDDFVVVAKSELAPYCTFGVSDKTTPEWAEKFADALTALNRDHLAEVDGERVKVLKAAKIDGFETFDLAEYDILHDWSRAAKMPPYEEY